VLAIGTILRHNLVENRGNYNTKPRENTFVEKKNSQDKRKIELSGMGTLRFEIEMVIFCK
jgi:hypothetical protein